MSMIEKDAVWLLESIIANVDGHIYWKDLDGVYLGCNNNQAYFLGLSSRDEIVGLTDYDLAWNISADVMQATDKDVIASGSKTIREEPVVMPNGETRVFLSEKIPLFDSNGNIIGVLGLSTNITEKKQLEKQVQAKLGLEINSRAKTDLLKAIDSKIRIPLQTMMSISSLLCAEKTYRTDILAKAALEMKATLDSIQQYSETIDDIFSDIKDDFTLESLFNKILADIDSRIENKDYQIYISFQDDLPIEIYGNPFILNQIFSILIGNAIKHSNNRTCYIKVSADPILAEEVSFSFVVSNVGNTISQSALLQLSQEKNSLEEAYTPSFKDGFKLSACYEYIRLLGGDMKISSDPETGTEIEVIFNLRTNCKNSNQNNLSLMGCENIAIIENDQRKAEFFDHLINGNKAFFTGFCELSGKTLQDFQLILCQADFATQLDKFVDDKTQDTPLPLVLIYGRNDKVPSDITVRKIQPINLGACLLAPEVVREIYEYWNDNNYKISFSKPLILVVEENEGNALALGMVLENLGCKTKICYTGQEALHYLDDEPRVNMVLSDFNLPDQDGIELIKQIKQRTVANIITISANMREEQKENCFHAGAVDVLIKPALTDEIAQVINEFCLFD